MQNNQLKDTERTYIIIVISLILGLLFDYFFYNKIPGISFPLYVFLIISGLFLIAKFFKRKVSREILRNELYQSGFLYCPKKYRKI